MSKISLLYGTKADPESGCGGAVLALATIGGLGYLAPAGPVGAAAGGGAPACPYAGNAVLRSRPCRVRIDIIDYSFKDHHMLFIVIGFTPIPQF